MPLKGVNWVAQKPQADHKPMAGWVRLSPQNDGLKTKCVFICKAEPSRAMIAAVDEVYKRLLDAER